MGSFKGLCPFKKLLTLSFEGRGIKGDGVEIPYPTRINLSSMV